MPAAAPRSRSSRPTARRPPRPPRARSNLRATNAPKTGWARSRASTRATSWQRRTSTSSCAAAATPACRPRSRRHKRARRWPCWTFSPKPRGRNWATTSARSTRSGWLKRGTGLTRPATSWPSSSDAAVGASAPRSSASSWRTPATCWTTSWRRFPTPPTSSTWKPARRKSRWPTTCPTAATTRSRAAASSRGLPPSKTSARRTRTPCADARACRA